MRIPVAIRAALLLGVLSSVLGCRSSSKLLHPEDPVFSQPSPALYKVLLATTKGDIVLEVHRDWSPHGSDRFYNLVRYGYYDNTAVFRIRAGTWAQFGIAADPKVAQAWRSRTMPDDPRVESNVRGTVAYAFKEPNGKTTQMFINLRDNRSTHDQEPFVPFARVISGMEVADSLYNGYGEHAGGGIRGGKQDTAFAEGNAYFKRFPRLDYIRRAKIVR